MNEKRHLDELSGEIVDAAYKLHAALGPGLLESVYEALLARDLGRRGLMVQRQKRLSFEYDGMTFIDSLKVDLLVEGQIVVEIKSAEATQRVYMKQTLTYLRVLNLKVGLLINFGCASFKEGLRRVVNNYVPPHFGPRLIMSNNPGDHSRRYD